MKTHQILVANDDGVESPGLQAAVEAVMDLGEVTVVAPAYQQTAMGRSWHGSRDAALESIEYSAKGQNITAYRCPCSPALSVRHGIDVLFHEHKPDLIISGINYGENLGINMTVSGTVGAAYEAASFGIPAIAISKQTDLDTHMSYTEQDWETSIFFLKKFAKSVLGKTFPKDVDVLNVNVPANATPQTPWKLTTIERQIYFWGEIENPTKASKLSDRVYSVQIDPQTLVPGSDIHAFIVEQAVSVTPLSLDQTSRIGLDTLKHQLPLDF